MFTQNLTNICLIEVLGFLGEKTLVIFLDMFLVCMTKQNIALFYFVPQRAHVTPMLDHLQNSMICYCLKLESPGF